MSANGMVRPCSCPPVRDAGRLAIKGAQPCPNSPIRPLVPRQISTGDRTILGKISKRGNRYLRVLFVQAAWVVLIRPQSWERYGLKPWIEAAKKRLHHNVLAIALANKLARIQIRPSP